MSRDRAQRFRMSDVEAQVQACVLAPIGDATSEVGAERLRSKILQAWRKAGGALPIVEIRRCVYFVAGEERERFELWSNMKNGKP